MGLRELFLLRREEFEAFAAGLGVRQVLDGLSDAQLRSRPHPATGSIAWLLWHAARGEDWAINRIVTDQPQVLHAGGWQRRLNLEGGRVGTGMTDEEVGDFSSRVNVTALQDYYAAVRQRTNAVATNLSPAAWDGIPDDGQLRQAVFAEGAFGEFNEPPAWLERAYSRFYQGKPRSWFLTLHGLTHPYEHLGAAGVLRSLLLYNSS